MAESRARKTSGELGFIEERLLAQNSLAGLEQEKQWMINLFVGIGRLDPSAVAKFSSEWEKAYDAHGDRGYPEAES